MSEDRQRRWWWLSATAVVVVFVVDRIVKSAIRANVTPGEHIQVIPGLDIVHTTNRGIAFGLFPGHQRVVAVVTALALCFIAGALLASGRRTLAVMLGGGMLVGGAVGNLVDRLTHDGVTDFIAVTSHWPPFNVADMGIVIGAALAATGLLGERAT